MRLRFLIIDRVIKKLVLFATELCFLFNIVLPGLVRYT